MVNDLILLETMMDNMTGRQKDTCMLVRMLALRGLGNIASGSPEKVRANSVLLSPESWPGLGGRREHIAAGRCCLSKTGWVFWQDSRPPPRPGDGTSKTEVAAVLCITAAAGRHCGTALVQTSDCFRRHLYKSLALEESRPSLRAGWLAQTSQVTHAGSSIAPVQDL